MTEDQLQPRLKTGYISEFNGLRGLAAILVVAGHAAPVGHWVRSTNCAFISVRFFFVLSGFLITGILIDQVAKSHSVWRALGAFYVRRALRIFPAYYLFLLAFLIAGNEFVIRSLAWSLTYTTNLYFAYFGSSGAPLSHFWTLAVEEQFYLVWPVVLLLLFGRNRTALFVFVLLIFSAVIFRHVAAEYSASRQQILYPPISSLDSLLMGSFAAYCARVGHTLGRTIVRLLHISGAYVFLPILILLQVVEVIYGVQWVNSVTHGQLLFAFASVGIVLHYAIQTDRPPVGSRILNHPLLAYLGTISYGIYVYHFPWDRMFYERVLVKEYGFANDFLLHFFIVLALTILTAAISWHCIEKKILQWKSKFPYEKA